VTSTLRRSLVGVAAVIISVACTDCAGTSPIGGGRPSSGVSGDLVYIGGAAASSTTSPTPRPTSVTAFTLDGAIAASAHFSEGKSFTLYIEPGTYRLVSKSGGARCPAVTVTVVADRFETIRIRCNVK
jgi:hypothetical protein